MCIHDDKKAVLLCKNCWYEHKQAFYCKKCRLAAMNEDDDDDEPTKFNVTEQGMIENS